MADITIVQRALFYDYNIPYSSPVRMIVNDILKASLIRSSEIGGMHHLSRYAASILGRIKTGGPMLEIGTYRGASALALLAGSQISGFRVPLITVDPYGLLSYVLPSGKTVKTVNDKCYQNMMKIMSEMCMKYNMRHVHYKMTDREFIEVVNPHLNFYLDNQVLTKPQFSFVFLDAQHTPEDVVRQAKWAVANLVPGGSVTIDDAVFNEHTPVREALQKEFPQGEILDIGGAKLFFVIESKP